MFIRIPWVKKDRGTQYLTRRMEERANATNLQRIASMMEDQCRDQHGSRGKSQ